ncbi:AfsR/SARP family transcriptional regulator [Actinophytocola sp.]|uniref:AfsR/SARP family transcriptional regulator n=1 Tax=Actinophytocola sp. TaxID=1872138 RepID=UPI002D323FFF|nr:AfsR/SARP family transcriptional regulator [Actinophytocola sp.]HYQ69825.1 AfsR/SARP family transcriptional regulator [Actinophytocola sp.]
MTTFQVLGPVTAFDSAGAPVPLRAAKTRMLLGVLLAHANTRIPADSLFAVLWPAGPPRSARANLQTYVSDLRRLLPGGQQRLVLDRAGYRLLVRPGELDLHRFEELAERGHRELAGGRPARAAETLRRAGALWRGDPFEDVPDAAGAAVVQRLREQRWLVRETLAQTRLRLGAAAELVAELRAMVAEEPLRERLWLLLMLALSSSGRRSEALACYQRLYRLLDTELGIEPGDELRQLHQHILVT